MNLGADKIEIVKNFGWVGVPGRAVGRRRRSDIGTGRGLRSDTDTHERAWKIESRRLFRRREMGLNRVPGLRVRCRDVEPGRDGKPQRYYKRKTESVTAIHVTAIHGYSDLVILR